MTKPPADIRGAGRRLARWCVVVGCLLAMSVLSRASLAADPKPPVDIEKQSVQYHTEPGSAGGQGGGANSNPAVSAVGDLSHIVLALAIVIGIIFGLRWVARRFALVPTVGRSGRGVRLLSRTILSPKQQVLLLQVGRRVVVVGDAGAAGMRPLCEITDPDEVAALLGELKSSDTTVPTKSFGTLFNRASEPFNGSDADQPALAPAAGSTDGLSSDVVGLLDKVRGLRQQFDR